MKEIKEFSQDELKYVYERGKERMEYHTEKAAQYERIINDHTFYQNKDEAINNAKELNENSSHKYQVWAKVGKDEEYYYIENYYIVSNDWKVLMAAEYIGMEQILSI